MTSRLAGFERPCAMMRGPPPVRSSTRRVRFAASCPRAASGRSAAAAASAIPPDKKALRIVDCMSHPPQQRKLTRRLGGANFPPMDLKNTEREYDVEALARRDVRQQLSFGRRLRLYFDRFILLKAVTRGSEEARSEALRYNCRHRRLLLVYARRWCTVA